MYMNFGQCIIKAYIDLRDKLHMVAIIGYCKICYEEVEM